LIGTSCAFGGWVSDKAATGEGRRGAGRRENNQKSQISKGGLRKTNRSSAYSVHMDPPKRSYERNSSVFFGLTSESFKEDNKVRHDQWTLQEAVALLLCFSVVLGSGFLLGILSWKYRRSNLDAVIVTLLSWPQDFTARFIVILCIEAALSGICCCCCCCCYFGGIHRLASSSRDDKDDDEKVNSTNIDSSRLGGNETTSSLSNDNRIVHSNSAVVVDGNYEKEKNRGCNNGTHAGNAITLRLSSDVPSCSIDEKGRVDSIKGDVRGLMVGMRILRINGVSVDNNISVIRRLLRRAHALSDEFSVEFEKVTQSAENSMLFSPSDIEEMKCAAGLMEQNTKHKDRPGVIKATFGNGEEKQKIRMRLEIAKFLGVNESELLSDDDGVDGTSSDDEPGWNGKEVSVSSIQSGVNLPHLDPMFNEMRLTTAQHRRDALPEF